MCLEAAVVCFQRVGF
jgi:uncharacterized protein (DUF433 family)